MKDHKENSLEAGEAELQQALQNFRQSVHAWSEAEYSRPRLLRPAVVHHTWKWALTWAVGCVLAIGGLGLGLYEHHQQQWAKDNGAQQGQQHQAVASATHSAAPAVAAPVAEEPAQQIAKVEAGEPDANLLAAVDSDVSRQVPSAMEPLAELMEGNLSQ
jgi:hypothetical protein